MLPSNFLKPPIKEIIPKWWIVILSLFGMALFSILFTSWIQSIFLSVYLAIGNQIDLKASFIDDYAFRWAFTFWAFVITMPFVFGIWRHLSKPVVGVKTKRNLQRTHWQMLSANMPTVSFITRLLTIVFYLISVLYLSYFVNVIEYIVSVTCLCAITSLLQNFVWLKLYYKCGYSICKLVVLFVFGATLIATIPIINIQKIDAFLDKTYPLRELEITLPEVQGKLNRIYKRSLSQIIYIGKHSESGDWQFAVNDNKIETSLKNLIYNLGQERLKIDERLQHKMTIELIVDSNYPLKLLKPIIHELQLWQFYNVQFGARKSIDPNIILGTEGIKMNLPPMCENKAVELYKAWGIDTLLIPQNFAWCNQSIQYNEVYVAVKGLSINGDFYEKEDFKKHFKTLINSEKNTFKVEFADDLTHGDFLKNYSFIKNVYAELLNELSMIIYQKSFNDLNRENQKLIRQQIQRNFLIRW